VGHHGGLSIQPAVALQQQDRKWLAVSTSGPEIGVVDSTPGWPEQAAARPEFVCCTVTELHAIR